MEAKANTKSYTVGKIPQEADKKIVIYEDGQAYLSVSFIKKYVDITSKVYKNPNRVVLRKGNGQVTYRVLDKDTQLRGLGGIRAKVVTEMKKGEKLLVVKTMDKWVEAVTLNGHRGYVKKSALGAVRKITYSNNFQEPVYNHIKADKPISLGWHQVTTTVANANLSKVLQKTKGLTVVAPTWYYLKDNVGGIGSLASSSYVMTAHQKGLKVWALVSNFEMQNINTTAVLTRTGNRDRLVKNLITAAVKAKVDGINVDFESLSNEVGYGYIQFIRELSVQCEAHHLVLSVDNYPPSAYTGVYYRSEEATFADYVVLMAYDEHFSGSDSGSVSSIGYVKNSVDSLKKEVPKEQMVLGLPFYSRVWKTKNGSTSSNALGMAQINTIIKNNNASKVWNAKAGQHYVKFDDQGAKCQIWMEDAKSLKLKMDVMKSEQLAGSAYWKLGYETDDVWSVLS